MNWSLSGTLIWRKLRPEIDAIVGNSPLGEELIKLSRVQSEDDWINIVVEVATGRNQEASRKGEEQGRRQLLLSSLL